MRSSRSRRKCCASARRWRAMAGSPGRRSPAACCTRSTAATCSASGGVTPKEHVEVQAAAQKLVDSSISKTANVPTDFAYAKFKDIYLYAHEQGLKGCTTFRFNPEAFQGVLVKEQDLKNTIYKFTLEDGTVVEARGDEEIDYDGELHTAANLFDSIKDGYYGRM